jgi:hypothetical protein
VSLLLFLLIALAEGRDFATWTAHQVRPETPPEIAESYRFTGDFFPTLARDAIRKPAAVEIEEIGQSVGRRPIWAFHVSEPGIPVRQQVLIFAGIHALEWISTEVAVDILSELIRYPPRGVRVTVIPLLNPDGRAKVELDLIAGRNTYRRGNGPEVDLNRNFAQNREAKAIWRHILPGYYQSAGSTALDQPESAALDALLRREMYDRSASLHAFGGYFYYPWTGLWERPPDHRNFVAIGREMEAAQGAYAYRTRQLSRWGFFFRAHGTEIDHIYGEYGTLPFLVELTRSGADPRRPRESLKRYFRWYNPKDSLPHRQRGVSAMRALIRTEVSPTVPAP